MVKRSIRLYKYHSLGNDFLLYESDDSGLPKARISRLAATWCHRHTGIGADGLLWLRKIERSATDIRVDIFNADGSWAERSGNGQRIVGVHLMMRRKTKKREFTIETSVGPARVDVAIRKGSKMSTAYMAPPDFQTSSLPMISTKEKIVGQGMTFGQERLKVTCLSVGNPHVVVHVKRFMENWKAIGQLIELDKRFQKRTNVEFVRLVSRNILDVLVWERGAGETGSSGTGAAASLSAMVVAGKSSRSVTINFPAGKMQASWPSDSSEISTTAPVEFVGVIEVPR